MGRNLPPKLTRAHAAAVVAELRKLTPMQRRRVRRPGYEAATRDWRFWVGGLSPLVAILAFYFLARRVHDKRAIIGLVLGIEALAVGGLMFALVVMHSVALRVTSLQFPNLCKTCGYDLTGNTTGVCSECGSAIARRPTSPV